MPFEHVLQARFPGAIPEERFVEGTYAALLERGFDAENAIACVGVCRDELCRSLVDRIERRWGEAFNFSSLAGMLFLGRTGFSAAHEHAPRVDGRERYVYVAMPHVGIGPAGQLGQCLRLGQGGTSVACGALAAFLGELRAGRVDAGLDADDVEQSLLRAALLRRLEWGVTPDLVGLTRRAHQEILATLERMIELTVDPAIADWAVLSGVQVHGPGNRPWIWPATMYSVVRGERREVCLAGRPSVAP